MKGNKIILKNFTDRITEDDCRTLCSKFGTIG